MTGTRTFPNLDARIAEIRDGLEIVAVRRLGNRDDARDAVQETVARLLARVREGAIATEGELAPIAWGIARHVIADVLRERARPLADVADVESRTRGPLDQLISDDETRRVRRALERLSPDDRLLLHRCFVDGEKIGRIADALGEPAERVRKRKSRALQRLAALLNADDQPSGHEFGRAPMEEA